MQIRVQVNEEGALRNQRFAFTDKFTLLSELLQNARRAGASRITIQYDEAPKVLRVIDDGHGIKDFQKLLTFNESGWNADVCNEELPFGIGFSKCLYSASRCIVSSHNRRIDFLCADALARKTIDVVDIPHHPYTAIELHDVDLPGLIRTYDRIAWMCSGFPIPVCFNGTDLPRPHAIDSLPFMDTDIGKVYLKGINGSGTKSTLVFLQGFSVARPYYVDDDINIVHLDATKFVARLPDRDRLIDETEQVRRIDLYLRDPTLTLGRSDHNPALNVAGTEPGTVSATVWQDLSVANRGARTRAQLDAGQLTGLWNSRHSSCYSN
jgi:hypothetical protein